MKPSVFKMEISAPLTMAASFTCAVALAIGHEAFYQGLNGRPTSTPGHLLSSITHRVSDQQINVSIGTLFAFLVKTFLGITVTICFEQFAWRSVKARKTNISVIDDLFSALGNQFTLFNIKLWRHYPLSMLLASIFWVLPIASVITPATLNVRMSSFTNSTFITVPQVDFNSQNFYSVGTFSMGPALLVFYDVAKPVVRQVVSATSAQGKIMDIASPSVNSSWVLEFYGPTLDCKKVGGSLYESIQINIEEVFNATVSSPSNGKTWAVFSYGYLAWVPDDPATNGSVPFTRAQNNTYQQRWETLGSRNKFVDPQLDVPMSLFVTTFPQVTQNTSTPLDDALASVRSPEILRCELQNASYVTNFTYENGAQDIHVMSRKYLNDVPYLQTITGVPDIFWSDLYNSRLIQNWAYQSLMEEFSRVMVGSIANYIGKAGLWGYNTSYSLSETINTTVMATVLSETRELLRIEQAAGVNSDLADFQSIWEKDTVTQSTGQGRPLATSIETLFHNITLSLMSSDLLQPNLPSESQDVNVTMTFYRNVYSYSQSILWTAYATAIGVSLACVLLGIMAYRLNNGSYTTQFSTILRTTRHAELSNEIQMSDSSGKSPVPKCVAQSTIVFDSSRHDDEQECEEKRAGRNTPLADTLQVCNDTQSTLTARSSVSSDSDTSDHLRLHSVTRAQSSPI